MMKRIETRKKRMKKIGEIKLTTVYERMGRARTPHMHA